MHHGIRRTMGALFIVLICVLVLLGVQPNAPTPTPTHTPTLSHPPLLLPHHTIHTHTHVPHILCAPWPYLPWVLVMVLVITTALDCSQFRIRCNEPALDYTTDDTTPLPAAAHTNTACRFAHHVCTTAKRDNILQQNGEHGRDFAAACGRVGAPRTGWDERRVWEAFLGMDCLKDRAGQGAGDRAAAGGPTCGGGQEASLGRCLLVPPVSVLGAGRNCSGPEPLVCSADPAAER